jgi:hypothetical protein
LAETVVWSLFRLTAGQAPAVFANIFPLYVRPSGRTDMQNSSLNIYGFKYRFRGRNYATDLVASDPDEAVARIRAMAEAVLIGDFVEHPSEPKSF